MAVLQLFHRVATLSVVALTVGIVYAQNETTNATLSTTLAPAPTPLETPQPIPAPQPEVNNVTIEFLGRSGGIRLSSGNDTIMLQWDRILELDASDRTVNRVNNFASQDFEWTVANRSEGSLTAVLDAVLTVRPAGVDVPWRLTVSLLSEGAEIQDGNETFFATANSLKITLEAEDWPFDNDENRLTFGASLMCQTGGDDEGEEEESTEEDGGGRGNGGGRGPRTREDEEEASTPEEGNESAGDATMPANGTLPANGTMAGFVENNTVVLPCGSLQLNQEVIIDNASTTIETNIDVSASGRRADIGFVFPSFNRTLFYDPVMSAVGADTGGFTEVIMAPVPADGEGEEGTAEETTDLFAAAGIGAVNRVLWFGLLLACFSLH